MDMLLVGVTALSLAMAIAMGAMVWRMVREDRRRSDARVAALVELTQSGAELLLSRADVRRADVARADVRRADVQPADVRRSDVPRADVPATLPVDTDPLGDAELRVPDTGVSGVAELFAEPARSSTWTARLVAVAAMAVLASGAGYVLLLPPTTGTAGADATSAPRAKTAPLELLSLKHAQSAGALTVTGLVQNPRSSAPVARVVVTALAFAADGTLLASGRAPLDYTTLAPGDESPFVVSVAVRGRVARYRIGFRSEGGGVIAHLDKRQAEAVAMK